MPDSEGSTAEELLVLARRSLSATRRMQDVRSVVVEETRVWDTTPAEAVVSSYTLLLPNRYQLRLAEITHTLDGDVFWQQPELPAAIRERAAANVRRDFAIKAVQFLGQAIPPLKPSFGGQTRTLDGRLVDMIDFGDRDERQLTLVLDAATHRPTSVRYSSPCGLTEEGLEDYRVVNGVLVPFQIRYICGEYRARIRHTAIRVDDQGVTPGAFVSHQEGKGDI
jgi:hypothetical protein